MHKMISGTYDPQPVTYSVIFQYKCILVRCQQAQSVMGMYEALTFPSHC